MNTITVGVFDLLHEGHVNLLREMREMAQDGSVLVGLHSGRSTFLNKGRFPVQRTSHREHNLKMTGLVDRVFIVRDCDPGHRLRTELAHGEWTYLRGDDWPDFPGRDVIEEHGIPIVLVPYTKGTSSTERRCEL